MSYCSFNEHKCQNDCIWRQFINESACFSMICNLNVLINIYIRWVLKNEACLFFRAARCIVYGTDGAVYYHVGAVHYRVGVDYYRVGVVRMCD